MSGRRIENLQSVSILNITVCGHCAFANRANCTVNATIYVLSHPLKSNKTFTHCTSRRKLALYWCIGGDDGVLFSFIALEIIYCRHALALELYLSHLPDCARSRQCIASRCAQLPALWEMRVSAASLQGAKNARLGYKHRSSLLPLRHI